MMGDRHLVSLIVIRLVLEYQVEQEFILAGILFVMYTKRKTTFAVIAASSTKNGSMKAVGGILPMMRSLMMPPPVAVTIASMLMPKISISLRMPAIAPDTAKATVPMISVIKMKSVVSTPLL